MKVAHAVAAAAAPAGTTFTVVSLLTGMIWGAPTWGTAFTWDPRIVFQVVMLLFFFGCLALRSAIDDQSRSDRATAVLAIVGSINVPIVHYSVVWWNSLHQPPTLMRLDKPAIHITMAWPLLTMLLGFTLYLVYIILTRTRAELLRRERGAWLREALATEGAA
jgi:heme exporter protein C